jgi:hypothetical protein
MDTPNPRLSISYRPAHKAPSAGHLLHSLALQGLAAHLELTTTTEGRIKHARLELADGREYLISQDGAHITAHGSLYLFEALPAPSAYLEIGEPLAYTESHTTRTRATPATLAELNSPKTPDTERGH